jgi:hypothetical protein
LTKERVGDKVHVTFDAHDGVRKYEFKGAAAKSIMKGRDPGDMTGKLIEHKKAK